MNAIFRNALFLLVGLVMSAAVTSSSAATAAELNRDAQKTLNKLYSKIPVAKQLGEKAVAILVFPSVTKAGLGIGGQYGEGALIQNGKAVAYYTTAGASYGLQAGAQKYGYVMFFMNDKALKSLEDNDGFEVGVGPSVVVMDDSKAMAKTATTTTMKDDIYAFIFGQKGLMAGLGIQGNKITKVNK